MTPLRAQEQFQRQHQAVLQDMEKLKSDQAELSKARSGYESEYFQVVVPIYVFKGSFEAKEA